jgi:hypothetical protein
MTLQRTDIHRPSVIVPDDYDYVCTLGDNEFGVGRAEMEAFNNHRLRTGGRMSDHAHGGSCHICGALAIYRVIWYHLPSNSYIATGYDCADKLGGGDPEVFKRLKDEAARSRKAKAGKEKAKRILEELGLFRAWEIAELPWVYSNRHRSIIQQMIGKLIRYGDLSEKQLEFLTKLIKQHDDYEARKDEIEAERKAQYDAAKPIPFSDKRGTVVGRVLSIKAVESDYGVTMKMLVIADDGWKVFGSIPAGTMSQVEGFGRGCKVQFDAKVQVSDDDPKFGFYSRPTKLKLLEAVEPEDE